MYPIALHLQGKKCIVFGAGKVAQRRVWGLLESGAEVTVAAPEPMPVCWKNAKADLFAAALCTGTAGGESAGVCCN